MREALKHIDRIVVKVGTSILTSSQGRISRAHLERLVRDVVAIKSLDKKVALVSSGAIAYGMETIGLRKRPKSLSQLQACAAIGQGKLMHAYEQCFADHEVKTAQVLLTRDGIEDRDRFLAARNTLEELFKMEALPIINENDTVATEEIAFGDNDILSVHVSHLMHADLLIILSDVDGFFLRDGTRLRQVNSGREIDQELVKHLKDTKKERTVGGMRAKLEAARVAMRLGVSLLIVNGHEEGILSRALRGEDVGTLFVAGAKPHNARKEWIAFTAPRKGTLVVDNGAFQALREGKRSLLATGVKKSKGDFKKQDVVELATADGTIFGRGVTRFNRTELDQVMGKKSSEIQAILGSAASSEVIHRNDLLIWDA